MAIVSATAISGTARVGRRTRDLVKRLEPGDVAVIDHRNLDRIAAEELAACGGPRHLERGALLGRDLSQHLISLYGEFRSISAAIGRVPLLERLNSLGRVN